MTYKSKLYEVEEEYRKLLFHSWEDARSFILTCLLIGLVSGGLCFLLLKFCNIIVIKIIVLILGVIVSMAIGMVIGSLPQIFKLPEYLKKKEIAEKYDKEQNEFRERRESEIKAKYPHAYHLTTLGIGYSWNPPLIADLSLERHYYDYNDFSAFQGRYLPKNRRDNIFNIKEEEWMKREEAAIRCEERVSMRCEISRYCHKYNKYPLAFYLFCRDECHAHFFTDSEYPRDMLLPGMRKPERFKTDKVDWSPTTYFTWLEGGLRTLRVYHGTDWSYFPPIYSECLKKVCEKLETIDEEKLKKEQEKLQIELKEEELRIKYNYNVYNVNDRDKYVDAFLDYMGVSENKMEYVIANLKRLDEFINLEKAKQK